MFGGTRSSTRRALTALAFAIGAAAAGPAGAVEWYTGRKPVAQPPSGFFAWAKPLKPVDDWIIGDAPKPDAAPEPAAAKTADYQALSMVGPKPAAPEGPKSSWIISTPKEEEKPEPEEAPSAPERKSRIAWDNSFSMTNRNSLSYNVGLTASGNRSLEQSGARFHVEGQMETPCCFGSSQGGSSSTQFGGALTIGYEWITEKGSFAAYAGMNMQNAAKYMLEVSGSGIGLQASVDLSLNPTERFMLSASGTYSTLNNSYYSRAKAGIAIFEGVYVGPEVSFIGENTSRQQRYGAFISGISVRNLQFGLSGGYVINPKRGNGAYAMLDIRASFW